METPNSSIASERMRLDHAKNDSVLAQKYAEMYNEYLTWEEVIQRHNEQMELEIYDHLEYTHPFATICQPTGIVFESINHFQDVAEYPEFVKDLESRGVTVAEVVRGGMHMIASTRDGKVFTVGSNEYGALGRSLKNWKEGEIPGEVVFPYSETKDPVAPIAAGFSHCAAVVNGDLYIWGTFCDENGEPFGLIAESKETIIWQPTKVTTPWKISRLMSGDNHIALLSREGRRHVLTMGASEAAIGRPYDMKGEEFRTYSSRDYKLTPIELTKYGPWDHFNVVAHADMTIVHVVMRSKSLAFANFGRFYIFGDYTSSVHQESNPVLDFRADSIKFQVTNRKPRKRPLHYMEKHLVEYLMPRQGKVKVVCGSDFSESVPAANGFIDTVLECYSNHHNLVLRPDDLLTSILVQVHLYLNGNSKNVEHNSKTLKIELDSLKMDSVITEHKNLVYKLLAVADTKSQSDDLQELIETTFSTTTLDDKLIKALLPYSKAKKPFDYELCAICGIPSVTLLGTLEDWTNLRAKIDLLETLGFPEWLAMQRPILDQFVSARSGAVDQLFWREICHLESGYGGPYINGWITVFSAVSEYGEFRKQTESDWPRFLKSEISPGYLEVDLEIGCKGNEAKQSGTVIIGHVGKKILSDKLTVQPKSGWAITISNLKGSAVKN